MSQIIPIYIPTFIGDQNYNPTRVLPHIYFYNGLIDCETYWIESGSATFGGVTIQQNAFPYFDNYNVVSGSFPTTDSLSLLFNNEGASYGEVPTNNLYTTYWERYVSLLYNPYTRLLTCEAIIPLADYVKMELNDVVNFRGNYYHLRAINDYSLKTGECSLQLLGPIIADTISDAQPEPPPPPTPDATASIKLSEWNESPTAFLDANLFVSGTAYFFSGDFTQSISGGTTANVTLEVKDTSPTVWGSYKTGSAALIIRDNGSLVTSSVNLYYSGSGDQSYTIPVTFTSGHNFEITGSTTAITGSTPPITGYLIENCDTSAELKVSFSGGGRPTEDVFVSSDIPTGGCWQILSTTSDALDYSNIVNDGEFVDCATCLTPPSVYEYTGCGRGDNVSETCSDASNNRTFYSDCDTFDFGAGCYVYVDTFPNPLTGYNNVYMNGSTWDISPVTGIVIDLSSVQC
jgi:hypothetical protein